MFPVEFKQDRLWNAFCKVNCDKIFVWVLLMKIFDVNIDALEADLSFRLKRQNLISSNLANADTPGYRSKDLRFGDALKDVYDKKDNKTAYDASGNVIRGEKVDVEKTDKNHLDLLLDDGIKSEPYYDNYIVQAPGIDENDVDLDREMGRMAENSLMYSAASIAIKKKLGFLKYAASES